MFSSTLYYLERRALRRVLESVPRLSCPLREQMTPSELAVYLSDPGP